MYWSLTRLLQGVWLEQMTFESRLNSKTYQKLFLTNSNKICHSFAPLKVAVMFFSHCRDERERKQTMFFRIPDKISTSIYD